MDSLQQFFFEGWVGIALGILSLASGVLSLVVTFSRKHRAKGAHKHPGQGAHWATPALVEVVRTTTFSLGLLLVLSGVWIFTQRAMSPAPARHEQLTSAAWEALNRADYAAAAEAAGECVKLFGGQAVREQEALRASGAPPPPVGPASDEVQREIFARGILNDVATSYYIRGLALERAGRTGEAAEAYGEALKFPHARYWDPKGRWFNSPADDAAGRLAKLPGGGPG